MVLFTEDFEDTHVELHDDSKPELPPREPEFTPIDAVNQARQNPTNVMITKYKDSYYLDRDDLKRFMAAKQTDDYDDAVDCIVRAHQDDAPDICNSNLKVLMGSSDLKNCSDEEVTKMENANFEVVVY